MKKTLWLVTLIFGLSLTQSFAKPLGGSSLAMITSVEGKAKVLPAHGIKKHQAKVGENLFAGDQLISYRNTKVLITFLDDSKIILNENASLLLESNTRLKHERGEIYYRIVKRSKSRGLQVETPFSIIGIKGTEFIIRFDKEGEISLNEGLIEVRSLGAQFELHQKKSNNKFDTFQQKQDLEFSKYQEQQKQGFTTYVKKFDLHVHKVISFKSAQHCQQNCEKQVIEKSITPDIMKQFKSYQFMMGR